MFRRLAPQHDIFIVILRDVSPEESPLRCFAPAQHDHKGHRHSEGRKSRRISSEMFRSRTK